LEDGKKVSGFDEVFAFEGLERFRWDAKYPNSETNTLGAMRKINLHKKFQELFKNLNKTQNINQ